MSVQYVDSSRFEVAGGPPATDLAGHWDATDAATLTGDPVTTWADKIGSNDITFTTGPDTGGRTQNGLNVLDFDATQDGVFTTGVSMGFTTARTWVLAIVFDGPSSMMAAGVNGDSTPFLGYNGSTPYGRTSGVATATATLGDGTFGIVHYHFLGTGATDSIEIGYNDANVGTSGSNVSKTFDLFARYNGGLDLDGAVGEFLDYSATLDDTALTAAVDYLTDRWIP